MNSIKTLLSRSYKVCSTYVSLHEEFDFLRQFFRSNGFATSLFDSTLNKFLEKKCNPTVSTVPSDNSNKVVYFSLPYFGAQSEKLRDELILLFKKYFADIDFRIILVNKFTIGSFFNYKDKLPTGMRSSVIYEFSCTRCVSRYVGMTTRTLRCRVAEHAGRSFRTNIPLQNPPHSSIRSHAEQCGSPITIDQFKIIDSASLHSDLKILESLHIFKSRPVLNDAQSSYPLQLVCR